MFEQAVIYVRNSFLARSVVKREDARFVYFGKEAIQRTQLKIKTQRCSLRVVILRNVSGQSHFVIPNEQRTTVDAQMAPKLLHRGFEYVRKIQRASDGTR
jgi:hypothetical protein